MKTEWDQNKREEYRDEWQQMGEADGSRTIEYNNRQVYERIPDHLMINLKLEEGNGIVNLWYSTIEEGKNKLLAIEWKNIWICLVGQ